MLQLTQMIDAISVFLPFYNEEANIESVVLKTKKILGKNFKTWELILINDGSKDKTGEIITRLAKADQHIKPVQHPVNRGYGAALKSGFYSAKYPWIAFIDGDSQFDFSEITDFLAKQSETSADLVIGYYRKRQVSVIRKLNTTLWQLVVTILFGLNVKDIDCAFKLVSKKVIDTIPKLESERGAFISSELLIKARKSGFKIIEIPITHYPAKRVGTGANLNVIIKSFVDLFKLWAKLR